MADINISVPHLAGLYVDFGAPDKNINDEIHALNKEITDKKADIKRLFDTYLGTDIVWNILNIVQFSPVENDLDKAIITPINNRKTAILMCSIDSYDIYTIADVMYKLNVPTYIGEIYEWVATHIKKNTQISKDDFCTLSSIIIDTMNWIGEHKKVFLKLLTVDNIDIVRHIHLTYASMDSIRHSVNTWSKPLDVQLAGYYGNEKIRRTMQLRVVENVMQKYNL